MSFHDALLELLQGYEATVSRMREAIEAGDYQSAMSWEKEAHSFAAKVGYKYRDVQKILTEKLQEELQTQVSADLKANYSSGVVDLRYKGYLLGTLDLAMRRMKFYHYEKLDGTEYDGLEQSIEKSKGLIQKYERWNTKKGFWRQVLWPNPFNIFRRDEMREFVRKQLNSTRTHLRETEKELAWKKEHLPRLFEELIVAKREVFRHLKDRFKRVADDKNPHKLYIHYPREGLPETK